MNKKEKELVVCQMLTIKTLRNTGLDIEKAIRELELDNEECFGIAVEYFIDEVADVIGSLLETELEKALKEYYKDNVLQNTNSSRRYIEQLEKALKENSAK